MRTSVLASAAPTVVTRSSIGSSTRDMVITGEIKLDAFSHDARTAAEWTMGVLDAEQLRRLSELRPSGERHDVQLNHGSIRDTVWEYVIDDRTAAICIEHQTSALSMVGHSHVPLAYGYAEGTFIGGLAPAGTEMVVKPTGTVRWQRVEYDIAAAQQAIRAAGLPPRLGSRLAEGY